MACLGRDVSLLEGICTSIVVTGTYVGILYLPFNVGDRDDRRVILTRIASLTLLAMCLEYYVRSRLSVGMLQTFAHGGRVAAFLVGTGLTLLLYAGHVAVTPLRHLMTYSPLQHASRVIAMRNYVLAPLLEEVVFRRQSLLLWSCLPTVWRVLFSSLMFALAHVHHVRRMGLITVAFHMAYTFLFGVYAAALYINTATVWAPFAAHVVCNILELPDFSAIAAHRRSRLISALYATCIAVFAVCFTPLTMSLRSFEFASV